MEKKYESKKLTIFWKPDLCQHSGECVHGAPKVFEVDRKPWIIPENGTEEEIMKVIDKCPSWALSYKIKDEE